MEINNTGFLRNIKCSFGTQSLVRACNQIEVKTLLFVNSQTLTTHGTHGSEQAHTEVYHANAGITTMCVQSLSLLPKCAVTQHAINNSIE